MKRLLAIPLLLAGTAGVGVGLLFLVAAAGQPRRYLVGALGIAVGAALVGLGLRVYRQALAASPEQLRAEILELAARRNGEVSREDVAAMLGRRGDAAGAVLEQLERDRICRSARRDGASYYVFPELQPRLMVLRCEHCDAELPIAEQVDSCPRCGGVVRSRVERRAASDGSHRMDPS